MGLRWNEGQTDIYGMLRDGLSNKEIKARGYGYELVNKVKKAVKKGDAPPKARSEQKESMPGEPLYSATFKTTKVILNPIVAVRYDSVRHALGFGDDYSLEQCLDESTDIIAELVGAVPPGFSKPEQDRELRPREAKESGGNVRRKTK